jgi:hypothetical protein
MLVSKKTSVAFIRLKPVELETGRETAAEPPQTNEQRMCVG